MVDVDVMRLIRALTARVSRLETKPAPLYLEGSWTPTYVGSATAGVFTYTVQEGNYTRIGRKIFVQGRVTISAIGTPPVGTMTINGLPFTPAADANSHGAVSFGFISNFNYTNTAFELTGRIPPSDPRIVLAESFDNAVMVSAPAANFTNAACDLSFDGSYMV